MSTDGYEEMTQHRRWCFYAGPMAVRQHTSPKMDELLQRASGPINRKYAAQPEPSVDVLMQAYGRHLRCVPMVSMPLTGEQLSRKARAMHPSTLGLDGRSMPNNEPMPPMLMQWLASLLGFVRREGQWPPGDHMGVYDTCAD